MANKKTQPISDTKFKKELLKEKLADDVLEQIKEDAIHGDYEILYELLKMVPLKNLVQALPEERWKNYSIS